jgi:hypothetical protein
MPGSGDHNCFQFADDDPLVFDLGLGAWALAYADRGYAVLPLAIHAKQPHPMLGGEGGVHHATRDRRLITDWWRRDHFAGIGVATGAVSRLIVFDQDTKGGEDGLANFARELGAWIPQNVVDATPSGGRHAWLRTPAGLAVRGKQGLYPGVDVKGDGGYVVAPPSMVMRYGIERPGERPSDGVPLPYEWERGCPCSLPDMPDAERSCEWIGGQPSQGERAGLEGGLPADPEQHAKDGLPQGARNVTLYRDTCSMYRTYGTGPDGEDQVDRWLPQVLDNTVRAGFGDREVDAIRRWARAYVATQEAAGRELMTGWERAFGRVT